MSERSTRRQFIDRSCRLVGYVTIGGAAGLLAKRAAANSVYQVDRTSARAAICVGPRAC